MRSLLAAFLLLLLFTAPAEARSSRKKGAKAAPPKPQYEALTGVDQAAGTVTITMVNGVNATPRTFRVTPFTEIEVNGQRGTFADLRPGLMATHGLGMDPAVLSRLVLSPAPAEPAATKAKAKRKRR